MVKKKFLIIFIFSLVFSLFLGFNIASAADWKCVCMSGTVHILTADNLSQCEANCETICGDPLNYKSCDLIIDTSSGGSTKLTDPLGGKSPQQLIGQLIKAIIGIVGSLALVMFIYGGFTWMTAAGNAEAVTKGKNILIWATIGLVVIFTAYALVKFVFTSLGV